MFQARSALGSCCVLFVLLLLGGIAGRGEAGIEVVRDGDRSVEIGGRLQVQYHFVDPGDGDSTDDLFFRRLRPYIEGTVTGNWIAKLQFDLGKAADADEVAVKDAYMKYTGFGDSGLALTIGNAKPCFSREFLTSSKKQQQVERLFVGDHNYGVLDRVLGVKLEGASANGKLGFSVGAGAGNHDPDSRHMDFDTPVNDREDWNQGWTGSARVDVHPWGPEPFSQGDFHPSTVRATVSAAGFGWFNDDDRNTYTGEDGRAADERKADLDRAYGVELSGAFRGRGLSVDAEVHRVRGETVDGSFTGGLYLDGKTDLDAAAVQGGFMVMPGRLELAAAWDLLDASNYENTWYRVWFGVNWFLNKEKVKFQGTYRLGRNVDGADGADRDEVLLQGQFVF